MRIYDWLLVFRIQLGYLTPTLGTALTQDTNSTITERKLDRIVGNVLPTDWNEIWESIVDSKYFATFISTQQRSDLFLYQSGLVVVVFVVRIRIDYMGIVIL